MDITLRKFAGSIKRPKLIGPRREKTCLRRLANNTGADQPAHARSLISAFVIRLLESIISKLAKNEISILLASLCSRGDWFEFHFVENPEDRFSHVAAHLVSNLDKPNEKSQ